MNDDFLRPIATVDVALFTLADDRLAVALVERTAEPLAGRTALPGTYVHVDEDADLDAAAARVLREKCGLTGLFVEQLRTYSGATRDARGWSITTAFYALVPRRTFDEAGAAMRLAPAEGLDGLPFDHDRIVADGVARLRGKATYTTLPAKLLPQRFTLRELEEVYEAVLGRTVQTANFRRKFADLKAYGPHAGQPFLEPTDEKRGGRNRPAVLYRAATSDIVTFPQRFLSQPPVQLRWTRRPISVRRHQKYFPFRRSAFVLHG